MYPPVHTLLLADGAVQAYVGARIYPHGDAPQPVEPAYITWFVAGGAAENQLDGVPLIDSYVTTVRIWSGQASGQDVFIIGQAVRDALEARAYMEGVPTTLRDQETRRYSLQMQFRFWTGRRAIGSSSSN